MINFPLLDEVLEQITTHPETHVQTDWRCGSGMCFAGWAIELSGMQWISGPTEAHPAWVYAPEGLRTNWVFLRSEGAHSGVVASVDLEEHDEFIARMQREYTSVRYIEDAHHAAERLLGLDKHQSYDLFRATNRLVEINDLINGWRRLRVSA